MYNISNQKKANGQREPQKQHYIFISKLLRSISMPDANAPELINLSDHLSISNCETFNEIGQTM